MNTPVFECIYGLDIFECCGDFPCSKDNVPPHGEDCPGCSGFPTESAVAAIVPCATAEYGFTEERNKLIEDLLPAGTNIEGWQQALVDEFVEYVSGVVRSSESTDEITRVAGELEAHGALFLDPPDGGSVSPSEQVARLGKAYRKAHALLFAASEALETICDGAVSDRPQNMEVYAQCRNVLAAIEAVLHRDGASGVPPGPRDCPKDPSGCVG